MGVTNLQLKKWSGMVKGEMIKSSIIMDEMTEVIDLDNSEETQVEIVGTNIALEVASGSDRTAGTVVEDIPRNLVHNKSLEVQDQTKWEEEVKIPYKRLDKKMPLVGKQMTIAHARRFFAYGVGSTANYGGGAAVDHILTADFTRANSGLNTTILDSLHQTRELLVDQGHMPNPSDTFVAVSPVIWSRLHTISEVKGHEFNFSGMGKVATTRAFEYLDMTLMETPAGLGENMAAGALIDATHTPSKFKIDMSLYVAFAWVKYGLVQGFVNGGTLEGGGPPNRHVITEVNRHWETKRGIINAAMIYDILYVYTDATTDENVLSVAWKSTV